MRNTLLAAASALVLASPAVLAQTGTTTSGAAATDTRPAATTGAAATPNAAPMGTPSTTAADSSVSHAGPPKIVRSSRLRGQDIENPNGDNIGKVEELIIDPQSGQVQQVIVSVGGFLGIGKKDVALNWDQLQIHQEMRKTTTAPATGAPGTATAPAGTTPAPAAPAARADGTTATEASTAGRGDATVATRPTDRVRVVVNMTKEQLEAAPEFKFEDAVVNGPAASGAGMPATGTTAPASGTSR